MNLWAEYTDISYENLITHSLKFSLINSQNY